MKVKVSQKPNSQFKALSPITKYDETFFGLPKTTPIKALVLNREIPRKNRISIDESASSGD